MFLKTTSKIDTPGPVQSLVGIRWFLGQMTDLIQFTLGMCNEQRFDRVLEQR